MKLYSWRAFTASQQLADAGVAWADSAVDAEKIARMCLVQVTEVVN